MGERESGRERENVGERERELFNILGEFFFEGKPHFFVKYVNFEFFLIGL